MIEEQREAAAVDVGQQVAQQAQIAVDAQLLEGRPHFRAMVGRQLRQQQLAHFEALRQALFPLRPLLQQLPRIIGEFLHRVAGEDGCLAAHFLGRAGNDQHGQVVDVLQFSAAGPAFGEGATFGGPGR